MNKIFSVGDFIQKDTWFGDVYAQIIRVETFCIEVVHYNKGGTERWTEVIFDFENGRTTIFRQHIKHSDDIQMKNVTQSKHTGVVYMDNIYYGSFGRGKVWATNISDQPRTYVSNHRQQYQEGL